MKPSAEDVVDWFYATHDSRPEKCVRLKDHLKALADAREKALEEACDVTGWTRHRLDAEIRALRRPEGEKEE